MVKFNRFAILAMALAFSAFATLSSAATSPAKLYKAIEAQDMALVQKALKAKPLLEPACRPNEICKPLARASAKGNLDMVKALVEAGADPNGVNAYRDTAFIVAGQSLPKNTADEEVRVKAIRRYLMENGLDSNQSNHFGVTPFSGMAAQGNIELMEVALRHGAQVNHQSLETGDTPLMLAADYGKTEAVRWLLARGADVSLKNKRGLNALDHAKRSKRAEVEGLLQASR